MNEPGPFDRILDSSANRDKSARVILIGMGAVGLLLLALVLTGVLGGGNKGPASSGAASSASNGNSKLPKPPDGFEALSRLYTLSKPKNTAGPYALTVNLAQNLNDGRNLALYTSKSGKWERLTTATLSNNGATAVGQVAQMPDNVAVLRRTTSLVQVSGWLAAGAQADPGALDILGTINPVDFTPNPDGTLAGTATPLQPGKAIIAPTVRAAAQKDIDAVNTILASPALRDAHINALVQLALQSGNTGIDIDYERVNPARKADFTSFITVLADKLHQSSRSLTVTLPTPVKTGVTWDTGAYDWEELSKRTDQLKLQPEPDPSAYYKKMDEVLAFLKGKVDLKKVSLVISRLSYAKGTDGLQSMSLLDGMSLASLIEVRTTSQILPNTSVVIVGKNIFQDDGASGIHWDDSAFAVSFAYPATGKSGTRTVWLENALSVAFRLDLARRYGLGGIAIDDVSASPAAPAIWDPLRTYADSGTPALVSPNGTLLRPVWQVQAGTSDATTKGNVVWKAPPQPGAYDVSLIISDGVIRATQKVVLNVSAPGVTPGASTTGTPSASGTPRPTGTASPTATKRP